MTTILKTFPDQNGEFAPRVPFRTAYDHGCIRFMKVFEKPSMTKQEFKDQCDINKIVENFMRTGDASLLQKAHGAYLDLTSVPVSYQDALNLTIEAREAFDLLPAKVRAEYNNDVQTFLEAAYKDPDGVFGVMEAHTEPSDPAPAPTPQPDPSPAPAASPEPSGQPQTE